MADIADTRLLVHGSLGTQIVDGRTGAILGSIRGPQRSGWFVANADLSGHWVAWYETVQGSEDSWALFCADVADMRPQLLAEGVSRQVQIPLFSLREDWLVWYENRQDNRRVLGAKLRGRNLANGVEWSIDGALPFTQPQIMGERVWWTEHPRPDQTQVVLYAADCRTGERLEHVDLNNKIPLLYYPAISEDAVVWVVQGLTITDYGKVYVRFPDDSRWQLPGTARKVCLYGDVLVHDSYVDRGERIEQIGAIDFSAGTRWVIQESAVRSGEGDSWSMPGARFREDGPLVLERPYYDAQGLAGIEVNMIGIP